MTTVTGSAWYERLVDRLRDAVYRTPFSAVATSGRGAAQLVASITDSHPGDVARADQLFHGCYQFAGEEHRAPATPPWDVEGASPEWHAEAHAFDWLRDFRASGGGAASRKARELCMSWLDRDGENTLGGDPEILGRRVSAWLCNAGFLMRDSDIRFHEAFLASLGRQIRLLSRTAHGGANGVGRIAAAAGLVLAGLALARGDRLAQRGLGLMEVEIRRQILTDGGHISRSPSALLAAFAELARVHSTYHGLERASPPFLVNAIGRMAPMLRLLRHGDGGLALFNGGYEESPTAINALLTVAQDNDAAFASAPHSGYERMHADRLVLHVDTGAPPPRPFDACAHAGLLSFELSAGSERLIVNCGQAVPTNQSWWIASRASAAHSTLVIDDTNSVGISAGEGVIRRSAPPRVNRRDSDHGRYIEASHDGYREAFGIHHERALALAADGGGVRGEDRLVGGRAKPFAVRFHLHPRVRASLVRDGRGALLGLADGTGWVFAAQAGGLELHDSVYLGGRGEPRRSEQLVVTGLHAGRETSVHWRLDRAG